MATYLGIDYGDERIGLAVSADSTMALPLTVIANKGSLVPALSSVIKEHGVTDIVVGWPVSMRDAENERTRATEGFIKKVEAAFGLPVHKSDERLTTELVKRQRAARTYDAQAAAAILDTFLSRLP